MDAELLSNSRGRCPNSALTHRPNVYALVEGGDALHGFLTGPQRRRDRRNPAGAPGASPSEPLRAWGEMVPDRTVGRTYGFARQTRARVIRRVIEIAWQGCQSGGNLYHHKLSEVNHGQCRKSQRIDVAAACGTAS